MDRATINRVLFAAFIIALLIIFLPALFVAHENNKNRRIYHVPSQPSVPVYQAGEVTPHHLLPSVTVKNIGGVAQPAALVQEGGQLSVYDKVEDANTRLQQAKLVASAWLLQLPAYANQQLADQALAKLHAMNLTAFSYASKNGVLVYLGPELKQDVANELSAKVEQTLGVKAVVEPFNATEIGEG